MDDGAPGNSPIKKEEEEIVLEIVEDLKAPKKRVNMAIWQFILIIVATATIAIVGAGTVFKFYKNFTEDPADSSITSPTENKSAEPNVNIRLDPLNKVPNNKNISIKFFVGDQLEKLTPGISSEDKQKISSFLDEITEVCLPESDRQYNSDYYSGILQEIINKYKNEDELLILNNIDTIATLIGKLSDMSMIIPNKTDYCKEFLSYVANNLKENMFVHIMLPKKS